MSVLLLHCSGSTGAQWRALADELRPRHRVAAPDLIGYGATPGWSGRGAFSLASEASHVRSLIGSLGEPVHLVGHSYGGAVALHIARTRPELVRSLTLIEPSAFHLLRGGDEIDAVALREIMSVAADARAAMAIGDYGGGFGRFIDYWSGAGSWDAIPAQKRTLLAGQLGKVALEFHALISEPADLDDVRGVTAPTLLIQGDSTRLPPRRICARLRMALHDARFAVVPWAGHMLPITHRAQTNALIAAHIAAHAGALAAA